MVKYKNPELDRVFAALSDSTRRAILEKLAESDCGVSELAEPFEMSLPAVWKHLRVLEEAGLIQTQKNGRVKRCKLDASPMQEASNWIAYYKKFWEGRLDALAEFLEKQASEGEKNDHDQ